MNATISLKSDSLIKQITFTALFAALCCIGTVSITIPLPTGYANVGDVFALLAGWLLGPVFGTVAAGFGSCLADVLTGYAIYAPATLIIKASVAVIGYFACLLSKKLMKKAPDFVCRIISVILAESFMVLGYFIFETILYGAPTAALALFGNGMQGLLCATCAVLLSCALRPIKYVNRLFPHFDSNNKAQKKDKKD